MVPIQLRDDAEVHVEGDDRARVLVTEHEAMLDCLRERAGGISLFPCTPVDLHGDVMAQEVKDSSLRHLLPVPDEPDGSP